MQKHILSKNAIVRPKLPPHPIRNREMGFRLCVLERGKDDEKV